MLVQNKKEINNIKFIVENNKPKALIDNSCKLIQEQQQLYKYIKDIKDNTLTINYDVKDIVTRTKIGRSWKKLDIKSPNKPFIKEDKPRETSQAKYIQKYEQRKCHKCGGIGHFANNCLKKAEINDIVKTEDHNDKEEELDSEKDTEESETSESDQIIIINAQINNIDLIYEVLDVNPRLPQVGASDTSLKNIKDAKFYRKKPESVMGYTAHKSSISIVMVESQEAKVNLDTGAYCTCVGKSYLKTTVPDWEENLYQFKE
ncbi:hypothetical protein O181_090332 [Austropuccinia psidii MF-1]|uniref:CCHC-type domain-containing protein n=1 Tax=Austropuccinia psidii MF-1 TaxID=1389203 RepID=A0A9Q3IV61_9BASI|nr:hypothetical protein [Austropuccinia psidii MF-1]